MGFSSGEMELATPSFERALKHGDLVQVATLIDATPGLLGGTRKGTGWTPMHLAAWFGHTNLVALFLARGVKVDVTSDHDHSFGGCTPLHLAVCRGHRKVVEVLLSRGADPDRRDAAGFTALHLACFGSGPDGVELPILQRLIAAGADVNAWVGDLTPLGIAFETDNLHLVEMLREIGAIC